MIVVSSCLAGLAVRYNKSDCLDKKIKELINREEAVSVCPELLGGFSIPREPTEIIGGDGKNVLERTAKVVTRSGTDVTEQYINGAYLTLKKVKECHAVDGSGVTAALLEKNAIKVVSEERLDEIL
ncbi:DUF523 domain-containing protein [Sporolactobacillus shoreicorticis]|uniref:DUF523 domain-containing protein n=1 Tax=Sporolactobacillus shoreicorticis TaxID=1923877 RepID=A0ABW5RZT3_9BACL|nr:DUF523 domain-containing protein [Sporolactobacillus shoreicorticis]MCO7124759.1 DUF523 domain-containing protein [Sporolactobacillus shoreicorticis]